MGKVSGIVRSLFDHSNPPQMLSRAVTLFEAERWRVRKWVDEAPDSLWNERNLAPIQSRIDELLEELTWIESSWTSWAMTSSSKRRSRSLKWALQEDEVMEKIREIQRLNDTLFLHSAQEMEMSNTNQLRYEIDRLADLTSRRGIIENPKVNKPPSDNSHVTVKHPDTLSSEQDPRGATPVKPNHESKLIGPLFELSVEGLGIIATLLNSEAVVVLCDRLQIWGLDLFDHGHGLGLDAMLQMDYGGFQSPGLGLQLFYEIFIKLLLFIEIIFLALDPESVNGSYLKRLQKTLLRESSRKEVTDLSALRQEFIISTIEENPALNETLSPEIVASIFLLQIQEELDGLDSLNPAIISMRLVHSRRIERPEGYEETWVPRTDTLGIVDEDLELAHKVVDLLRVQEEDDLRKKEKSPMGILAVLFEDETRRLEEWRKSRKQATTTEVTGVLQNLRLVLKASVNQDLCTKQPANNEKAHDEELNTALGVFRECLAELERLDARDERGKKVDRRETEPELEDMGSLTART